jgi:transcriptional regulator with XRE-family HTH domain
MGILEGHFIKEKRKELGLTQLQLAEELKISHAPIYHLENGKESISLGKLRKIADRLDLEVIIRDKNGKAITEG